MSTKILWIEGRRNLTPSFVPGLREKGYLVETTPTGKAALELAPHLGPDLAVVNAASLRTSGVNICQSLRSHLNGHPILLIRDKQPVIETTAANQILALPFTMRKLLNRIRLLAPAKGGKALKAGPITLFFEDNAVQIDRGEPQQLTPHLTSLLKMLMQHRGEVVERERLFREVWQTDYMGDTRTLDVHISWLRRKIESNPRNPQYLKTLRGVGYLLAV